MSPEILKVTYHSFTCQGCKAKSNPHASRWWEVRSVPEDRLVARVPECLFLKLSNKGYAKSDAEKAILAEIQRIGPI